MRAGHVPTAVVGPLVARLLEQDGSDIETLARRADCHESTIRILIRQRYPGIDFDLADRLLCALGRPDLVPMPEVFRPRCPHCGHAFSEEYWTPSGGSLRRRYCSTRCRNAVNQRRYGKTSKGRAAYRRWREGPKGREWYANHYLGIA